MIALALCAVLASAQSGTLVLCGESFELPEALARELAGSAPHLVLDLDGAAPDPLAHGNSQALRPDLAGDWSAAREAALLPDLARAGAVVVQARTWLSCWQHFQYEQKDSRLEQELRAALRAGHPLVATGAAAAYCAAWSIVTREEIHKTARNPRRAEPELVVTGLEFARAWMVDTSTQAPAGAERLLRESQRFGNARALYLQGPVAWIVRAADGPVAEVVGSGCACVFDLARARRSREELRDGRLLLLHAGDQVRLGKELEPLSSAAPADAALEILHLSVRAQRLPGSTVAYSFDWLAAR